MPENTEPADELPFRKGDIVRLVKQPDGFTFLPAVGTEYEVTIAHAPSDSYLTGLYGPIKNCNLEPEYLELVYRPPTREEVEAMQARIAELEAALRAALATKQGEQA